MKELTIDAWSFLDFKESMKRDQNLSPTWVDSHWRRLQAYKVLESYYKNISREWLLDSSDATQASKREYGDAHLIVEQFLASLLGKKFYPQIDGLASQHNKIHSGEEVDPGELAMQDRIEQWFKDEQLRQKIIEQERQSLKLGDGVWVMGWSTSKNRPTARVYDPGMFFPVWGEEQVDEDFPSKVHIAYEFEKEDSTGTVRTYVRRITYELLPYEDDSKLEVPWRELPSDVSCFMSDGTWRVNEDTKKVDDFDESKAVWRVQNLDLGYDFIPVIHTPNTVAGQDFYGVSVLSMILQLFDDLINNDTDLQVASGLTASPVLTVSGGASLPTDANGQVVSYGPGTVYDVDEGGMNVLDMSRGLDALLKYSDYVLERLSINGRIPESLMGRVKPSEVPSGVALWLSFSSHTSFVEQMRLVRDDKYRLFLKFAQRMWQKEDPSLKVYDASLVFGSYLPADRSEALTMVTQAMNAKHRPMSTPMAVSILKEAGFPIEDAAAEIEAIQQEDYEGAGAYLDATGDIAGVREMLGLPPLVDEPVVAQPPQDPDFDPLA
jgi:hypothetical protein